MANEIWILGFDEDNEQFYCRSVDGHPITPTVKIEGATTGAERSKALALAVEAANKRRLRIASLQPWNEVLLIALHE